MANIIAVIWDCDKTLIDGYMQDPIFKEYKINPRDFWKKVDSIPEEYQAKGVRVNKDTYYLNYFIKCAHDGTFPELNNQKLREYGAKQKFYKGIPEIFEETKRMFKDDKSYPYIKVTVDEEFPRVASHPAVAYKDDSPSLCQQRDGRRIFL